jgi:hypothetical protein
MKRRSPETCYLCCMPIETAAERTTEHVLPRSFYEGRLVPENGLTLPAHLACNKSTESDEQLVFVALGQTTISPLHSPELKCRSNRSLQRDRALAADLLCQVVRGPGEKTVPAGGLARWVASLPERLRMGRHCATGICGAYERGPSSLTSPPAAPARAISPPHRSHCRTSIERPDGQSDKASRTQLLSRTSTSSSPSHSVERYVRRHRPQRMGRVPVAGRLFA